MADNTSNPAQRAIFFLAPIQLGSQTEKVRRPCPRKLSSAFPCDELTACRFDFAIRPLAELEVLAL